MTFPATDQSPILTEEEMARYRIERVRADQFHVDGYRYARLVDAVAQARRGMAERGERR